MIWKRNWGHYLLTINEGPPWELPLKIGNQETPTPVVTDSAISDRFVNGNIQQRISRAIGVRFNCFRNRVKQGHYLVYWASGKDNLADYFTKPHRTKNHRDIRGTHIFPKVNSSKNACYQVPTNLRGCVKPPPPMKWMTGRQGLLFLRTDKG